MTKIRYVIRMHKIFLLYASGIDYQDTIYLLEAYCCKHGIQYVADPNAAFNFKKEAHSDFYFDLQHFAVLCEKYFDFSKAGTLAQRVLAIVKAEHPEIFPNHKAA